MEEVGAEGLHDPLEVGQRGREGCSRCPVSELRIRLGFGFGKTEGEVKVHSYPA